jgi:hypothetical protein
MLVNSENTPSVAKGTAVKEAAAPNRGAFSFFTLLLKFTQMMLLARWSKTNCATAPAAARY